jgi:hypothetical protein
MHRWLLLVKSTDCRYAARFIVKQVRCFFKIGCPSLDT